MAVVSRGCHRADVAIELEQVLPQADVASSRCCYEQVLPSRSCCLEQVVPQVGVAWSRCCLEHEQTLSSSRCCHEHEQTLSSSRRCRRAMAASKGRLTLSSRCRRIMAAIEGRLPLSRGCRRGRAVVKRMWSSQLMITERRLSLRRCCSGGDVVLGEW